MTHIIHVNVLNVHDTHKYVNVLNVHDTHNVCKRSKCT